MTERTWRALVESVIDGLPDSVRARIPPVCLAPRPAKSHIALGIGRTWQGAFVGPAGDADDEDDERPVGLILLYLENLEPPTPEQLRLVLLHEIGHALGLDEADVHGLGLGP